MLGLGGHHPDSQGQSSSLETVEGRRFDTALFSALDALEQGQVSYAVIGGVAASGLGRPRSTQDIDIFVRPEDAEAVLSLLENHGFRTEKTNLTWLFKAFKEDVLVDIIFRSQGGIYFDDEMKNRAVKVNYHGRQVRLVSPEDFIIIKCAVHSEEGPHHWHDALAVLSQSKMDWDYLLHRARKAPRRLLALLIYAQSNDIFVPNQPIQQLHQTIFGEFKSVEGKEQPKKEEEVPKPSAPAKAPAPISVQDQARGTSGETYLAAQIRDNVINSGKTGSMDIEVFVEGNKILLRGPCQSEEQRRALKDLVQQLAPTHEIGDQMNVVHWEAPKEVEELQ